MPTKTIKRVVSNDENKENEEYDVEDICRYDPKRDRYLVKWQGYPRPAWEPIENLANCMDMVNRRRVNKNSASYHNQTCKEDMEQCTSWAQYSILRIGYRLRIWLSA